MLLNRVLTVRPGESASHRGRGWEEVTSRAIDVLAARGGPMAAILWGRDAQSLKPALGPIPWVESAHPSPLSASRGFFGSRPFSRVNRLLEEQGGASGGLARSRRNKVELSTIGSDMTSDTRMPALYIGHGAPPLLDDPTWSGAAGRVGGRPAAPEGRADRQRALGVGAGQPVRQRRPAGLRLRRLRREVLPDDLPDARRLGAGRAGGGDDARHRAGPPAPQPRPRPRRLGAAEDHVPRGRRPGAADVAAHPRPRAACSSSDVACARCATRAC